MPETNTPLTPDELLNKLLDALLEIAPGHTVHTNEDFGDNANSVVEIDGVDYEISVVLR